jgi:hypothetical protein
MTMAMERKKVFRKQRGSKRRDKLRTMLVFMAHNRCLKSGGRANHLVRQIPTFDALNHSEFDFGGLFQSLPMIKLFHLLKQKRHVHINNHPAPKEEHHYHRE